MLKFNLSRHRVIIDPVSLLIKEFKEVYDGDSNEDKHHATDVLSYVHIASQLDSEAPFFAARGDEVQELAARNIWGPKETRTVDISIFDEIIYAYLDAFEKPEARLVRTFQRKIDQLQDMLEKTTPTIDRSENMVSGTFNYVTNIPAMTKVMREMRALMQEKTELEAIVRQDSHKDAKIRGDKKISYLERKKVQDATRIERRRQETNTDEEEIPRTQPQTAGETMAERVTKKNRRKKEEVEDFGDESTLPEPDSTRVREGF